MRPINYLRGGVARARSFHRPATASDYFSLRKRSIISIPVCLSSTKPMCFSAICRNHSTSTPSTSGATSTATVTFTRPILDALKAKISSLPYGRFTVTSHLPNDLHLQKTEKLKKMRTASVFIPLCNRNGHASLLYTLRSQLVSTHKGQVSFPGGMVDIGENVIQAAVRETAEEIGVSMSTTGTTITTGATAITADMTSMRDKNMKEERTNIDIDNDDIEIIGIGQTVFSITGVLVTPILGYLKRDIRDMSHFIKSEEEVEQIFSRSIFRLNSPGFKTWETYHRDGKNATMPVFDDTRDIMGSPDSDIGQLIAPNGELVTVRKRRIWGLTAMLTEAVLQIVNEELKME
jgi:hypothetical protein